jgi:hypothetical protein
LNLKNAFDLKGCEHALFDEKLTNLNAGHRVSLASDNVCDTLLSNRYAVLYYLSARRRAGLGCDGGSCGWR